MIKAVFEDRDINLILQKQSQQQPLVCGSKKNNAAKEIKVCYKQTKDSQPERRRPI